MLDKFGERTRPIGVGSVEDDILHAFVHVGHRHAGLMRRKLEFRKDLARSLVVCSKKRAAAAIHAEKTAPFDLEEKKCFSVLPSEDSTLKDITVEEVWQTIQTALEK